MTIYIVNVEYLSPSDGKKVFAKVNQEGYKTISEAKEFIKSRSDYSSSLNEHFHYGRNHNYIIEEITVIGVK